MPVHSAVRPSTLDALDLHSLDVRICGCVLQVAGLNTVLVHACISRALESPDVFAVPTEDVLVSQTGVDRNGARIRVETSHEAVDVHTQGHRPPTELVEEDSPSRQKAIAPTLGACRGRCRLSSHTLDLSSKLLQLGADAHATAAAVY